MSAPGKDRRCRRDSFPGDRGPATSLWTATVVREPRLTHERIGLGGQAHGAVLPSAASNSATRAQQSICIIHQIVNASHQSALDQGATTARKSTGTDVTSRVQHSTKA